MKRMILGPFIFLLTIIWGAGSIYGDIPELVVSFKPEQDFKLFFLVSGYYLAPSASHFGDIYESGPIYSGITAGYKFSRNWYIWGGYAFLSKNGKSAVLEKPSRWKLAFSPLGRKYP